MRLSLTPSTEPTDYSFSHQIRTRFAETDAMGVIHHAAYLPYLEEARVALLRHLGQPYHEVRASGTDLVVLEVFVQYRLPLRFDDLVDLHLQVGAVTGTTFQIAYLLTVAAQVRATAVTVHGATDANGRPRRLPRLTGLTQFMEP